MIAQGISYNETVTMVTEICCNCGVPFGIPSNLRSVLKADPNKSFYCPNGHGQHYSKSTEQVLREQMASDAQGYKGRIEELENQFLDEMNARKKAERKLTRVHNGTCPCCNRHFMNLERHMKTKHPEIAPKKK